MPRISELVGGGAGWDLIPRYSSVWARDPLPGQRPRLQLCVRPGPSAWSASPGCHGGCRPCFVGGPATTSIHLPPRAAATELRVSTRKHPRQGDTSVGGGTTLGPPGLRGHGCPPVCAGPSAHSVGEGVPCMYACFQPCGKACARTRVRVNSRIGQKSFSANCRPRSYLVGQHLLLPFWNPDTTGDLSSHGSQLSAYPNLRGP